jgi:hypothetical protein
VKAIAQALYTRPVVFLAVVQAGVTTAAAAHVISGWIPVVTLAIVTVLQRQLVSPAGAKRGRRA